MISRRGLIIGAGALLGAGIIPSGGRVMGAAAGGGGGGGGTTFALVDHNKKAGTGATGTMNTSTADTMFAAVAYAGTAPTISDSNSNTWTALAAYGTVRGKIVIYYAKNITGGAGHTVSTSGNNAVALAVAAFSGGHLTSLFDSTAGSNGTNGDFGTTTSTGSITPSANGNVIISAMQTEDYQNDYSVDSGLTITDYVLNTFSGNDTGLALAYYTQPVAAAINPTWTRLAGGWWAVTTVASFKHA